MNSLSRHVSNRLSSSIVITRLQSSVAGGATNSSVNIEIPLYKERGSTDILRALERTIKRDPTAPRYKYHDDPYLIPLSNMSKRSFALAQEAGRKAAMWIRQQHANLFQHRVADPVIESFLPKTEYKSKDQVSEDILKNVIEDGNVADALTIYQLLEEQVSAETKLELLQLLCYYNNEEPLPEEFMEQKWFRNDQRQPSWKPCSTTDSLFAFLKDQGGQVTAEAFITMICGYAKYMNVDRAWKLFEEAESKNIPLTAEAFNSVINLIPALKEGGRERRELLIHLLNKMKTLEIQPNIGTFNSSLKVASAVTHRETAKELCRSLFTEFKNIGIAPSLASYYYALKIFYRKDDGPCNLLREILQEINNKEFTAEDKNDTAFFLTAMGVAANNLEDPVVSDKVHELLLTGDNYNFIGDGFKENNYYKHYFLLQVKNQSIDVFMNNYYDVFVPNIYTPEPVVMETILNALEANDPTMSREYLSRLWTHMIQFDHLERKNLVSKALNLMRVHCKPDKDSPFNKIFADAGLTVWDFVTTQQSKRIQKLNWDGTILADIAILCVRADEVDKSAKVISYLLKNQDSIIGIPDVEQVTEILDSLISLCFVPPAMDLIQYCAENGFQNTSAMAIKLQSNVSLTKWDQARLEGFVNSTIVTNPEKIPVV
ncbi:protein PTCD3 homolog, mitochondrial-like isoform X1 [Microplitis mediator]|uniref:protein PTCD3 homolog, mitochondrial-like isoform X1 n=1 Tax=Microplitis mediator TaxID=375433 RepID=UPI002553AC37|nr:protein PTCD3 homolog, mitochondrial-like isoform X1 [Microplitis mediator]